MKNFIYIFGFLMFSNFCFAQTSFLHVYPSGDAKYGSFSTKITDIEVMGDVRNITIVKFKNPFIEQVDGKLRFNSNVTTFPSRILKTESVKYSSSYKYKWRGVSYDKHFDITLIKNSSGICGTIIDIDNDKFYRIMPLDTVHSVLLEVEHTDFSCDISHGQAGSTGVNDENCEDVCLGHLDILFLIPPSVQITDPVSTFDLWVSDLEAAFQNSNIRNTVSYAYANTTWNSFSKWCQEDALLLSSNQSIKTLKSTFGADVVVMIAPPSQYVSGPLACVAEIGPISDKSTAVVPINLALDNHIFTHEIGHLYGGIHHHGAYPPQQSHLYASCASSHVINPLNVQTLMGIYQPRILHFSDPDISYLMYPTGTTTENNAGRIRATGCRVAAFTQSLNVNPIITATENNCQLNLQAIVDQNNPDYTYEWYWNLTGIFAGSSPANFIATGITLNIPEPISDPCINYFLHLKVKLFGIEVANTTTTQKGGICTANVQCNPPVSFRPVHSFNINNIQHSNDRASDVTLNDIPLKKTYRLFNIFGQLLGVYSHSDEISLKNSNLTQGLYILSTYEDGKIISSKKYFLSN
ncbi:MAG: hypothetical protein UZ09_BCD002001113 [Bacteroidetes bacterium OLB9]|nr:MAG: hypothetical protein UZ09_BCD002001113 [Bacteroidetes bacterium OLB9]